MTRDDVILSLLIGLALGLVLLLAAVVVGRNRRRQLGPDHEGATLSTPPLPPALPVPPQPRGRHHEDTVEIVPPGWMPPIGQRRIDAITDDTQIIKDDE